MPDRDAALEVLGEPGWTLLLDAGTAIDGAALGTRLDGLRAAELLAARRPEAAPGLRASALELVTEGRKLARKVGITEQLLAVREAVEQATPGRVATWHAQRIPEGARVLEIGCGCGGDSLALAHRAANLIACDIDPVRAACTHNNLMTLDLANARAVPGDGFALLEGDASRADVLFLDPSRRVGNRRLRDPEEWSPPLAAIRELARGPRRLFVKAAPSLDAEAVQDLFQVAYVSYAGECLESFLETPRDGEPRVSAVLLPDGGPAHVLSGRRGQAPDGPIGAAIHIPDPAALRARLLEELCERHGLHLVDPRVAILTGPAEVSTPWLTRYDVLESLPLQLTRVGNALRRLGASRVTVHCRAIDLTAPELQKRWKKAVKPGATGPEVDVFATREQDRPVAILTTRTPV